LVEAGFGEGEESPMLGMRRREFITLLSGAAADWGARSARRSRFTGKLTALAQRLGHPLTRCGQKPARNPAAQQAAAIRPKSLKTVHFR